MRLHRGIVLVSLVVLVGCRERYVPGTEADGGVDAPTDASVDDDVGSDVGHPCNGPPGLYVDGSCTELRLGVRRFEPRYPLWSDGATKERFVYLPPGGIIDTSDPDRWVFPVGTTFWKTFIRDGLRIETRINEKVGAGVGPSAWRLRTFAWSADQTSVSEVTEGVPDALGTGHDIPATSLCVRCHAGATADVGLGFSAIQLNHAGSEVSLAGLVADGVLSSPIPTTAAVVPGDATTEAALGYLHANCGNCHGGPNPEPAADPMVLWIDVGARDVSATGPYTTAVGHRSSWAGASMRVSPGMPDTSAIILRMQTRVATDQMPPIASELPHPEGIGAVRAWIRGL